MIPKKYRNLILRHHKHTQSAFGSILDHFGNFQKFRFLVIFGDFSKGPHLKKIKDNPENRDFLFAVFSTMMPKKMSKSYLEASQTYTK